MTTETSIVRLHRKAKYTNVSNELINDPRLTWQATGMLAYLLSLPNDWRVNSKDLTNRKANGRDATRRIMSELIALGYMQRTRGQLPDGKWYTIIHVFEEPLEIMCTNGTDAWNPGVGLSGVGFPGVIPTTEIPTTERPKVSLRETRRRMATSSEEDVLPAQREKVIEPAVRRKGRKAATDDGSEFSIDEVRQSQPKYIVRSKRPVGRRGAGYCAVSFALKVETRLPEWCAQLTDQSARKVRNKETGEMEYVKDGPSQTNVPALARKMSGWIDQHSWTDQDVLDVIDAFVSMVTNGYLKVNDKTIAPWRVFVSNIDKVLAHQKKMGKKSHSDEQWVSTL